MSRNNGNGQEVPNPEVVLTVKRRHWGTGRTRIDAGIFRGILSVT